MTLLILPKRKPLTEAEYDALIETGNYAVVCGAYYIHHLKTDKYYVGSTDNLGERWYNHKKELGTGTHKTKTLQAPYNDDPHILFSGWVTWEDREKAWDIEQELLDLYHPTGQLFNVATDARCSQRGRPLSDDHRAKLRIAHTGKKLSEDHCAKISTLKKGQTLTLEHIEKIKQASVGCWRKISVDGQVYASFREAREALGMNHGTLWYRVNSPHFPNYHYVNEPPLPQPFEV
jgi:group I intron endonuclease